MHLPSTAKLIAFLLFAFGVTGFCGGEPSVSGLVGPVAITRATYWMDGGSVSITLRDEKGTKRFVFYANDWLKTEKQHGGQIAVRAPRAEWHWLPENSAAERDVVSIVRAASIHTFGTADSKALDEASVAIKGKPDFQRVAIASLFRQLTNRGKPKPKENRSFPVIDAAW